MSSWRAHLLAGLRARNSYCMSAEQALGVSALFAELARNSFAKSICCNECKLAKQILGTQSAYAISLTVAPALQARSQVSPGGGKAPSLEVHSALIQPIHTACSLVHFSRHLVYACCYASWNAAWVPTDSGAQAALWPSIRSDICLKHLLTRSWHPSSQT